MPGRAGTRSARAALSSPLPPEREVLAQCGAEQCSSAMQCKAVRCGAAQCDAVHGRALCSLPRLAVAVRSMSPARFRAAQGLYGSRAQGTNKATVHDGH